MRGAPDSKADDLTIYATLPALPGTYIVYANRDGSTERSTVVAWGVLEDGAVVPLTISGAWDGVANRNNFVLHPDGSCGKYEQGWSTLEEAVEAVRQHGD